MKYDCKVPVKPTLHCVTLNTNGYFNKAFNFKSTYTDEVSHAIRDQREHEILAAALAELTEKEVTQISMSSLASRTGLTRTAIYQYFASVDDIFAELVINDMADLVNTMDSQIAQIDDPTERIRAWVLSSLEHLSSGEHAIIRRLSEINLAAEKRGIVRALHGQFMDSLSSPVKELELENAPSVCAHIAAVVNSAANRIDLGFDFAYEAAAAESFVMSAIRNM